MDWALWTWHSWGENGEGGLFQIPGCTHNSWSHLVSAHQSSCGKSSTETLLPQETEAVPAPSKSAGQVLRGHCGKHLVLLMHCVVCKLHSRGQKNSTVSGENSRVGIREHIVPSVWDLRLADFTGKPVPSPRTPVTLDTNCSSHSLQEGDIGHWEHTLIDCFTASTHKQWIV